MQEKWDLIKAAVREDAELNDLLYRVAADNMELYAGLHSQRDQARSLLLEQLAPTAAAASRSADAGRDELAREAGVVARLPVCGALPPQRLGAAAGGAGELAAASDSSCVDASPLLLCSCEPQLSMCACCGIGLA